MRHNGRTPLLASTMRPEHLNLREGDPRMAVCPDCQTWHRLTRSMINPHRSSDGVIASNNRPRRYFGDKPAGGRRCPGSAQRITIDITVEQWGEKLLAADSTATGRRSARQHYKPLPAPAPPIARMRPAPVNAADALTDYRDHLTMCRGSEASGRCGGAHRCATGARLAALYERLLRTQSCRDTARRVLARERVRFDRTYAAQAATRTAAEWTRQSETTADAAETAKRSGTLVEESNNVCRNRRTGTVSEFRGPEVPLEPLRIGT
ncbi:hypothetical protein [Streptomyces sp. NBC_01727]|uniref:hypothetical protein n=1 Tax=Streptomyces sp. NBC_01727 TaxID=2975924 RepID=UPI002E122DCD|nr:hypothetical protein OIE76_42520 [Streptomyces sp. NBC_01727]